VTYQIRIICYIAALCDWIRQWNIHVPLSVTC